MFFDHPRIVVILHDDNCDFRIHVLHMYVLPRGCAHGENTSHLDYNQVFH